MALNNLFDKDLSDLYSSYLNRKYGKKLAKKLIEWKERRFLTYSLSSIVLPVLFPFNKKYKGEYIIFKAFTTKTEVERVIRCSKEETGQLKVIELNGGFYIYDYLITLYLIDFLDFVFQIHDIFETGIKYYCESCTLDKTEKEYLKDTQLFESSFIRTILKYNPEHWENYSFSNEEEKFREFVRAGPFGLDFSERFIESLWESIGCPIIDLSNFDYTEFSIEFEKRWKLLVNDFSSLGFGLRVIPILSDEDIVRYVTLSPNLKKKRIESQLICYIAFKILPANIFSTTRADPSKYKRYKNLLIESLNPFIKKQIKQVKKEMREEMRQNSSEYQFKFRHEDEEVLRKEIIEYVSDKLITEYSYYYKKGKKHLPIWLNYTSLKTVSQMPEKVFDQDLIEEEILDNMDYLSTKSRNEMKEIQDDLRWIRPSYYFKEKIRGRLGKGRYWKKHISEKISTLTRKDGKDEDILTQDEDLEAVAREDKGLGWKSEQKPSKNPTMDTTHPQEIKINNKNYLTIEGLAGKVGRHPNTLRNMEERGEIQFIRKRVGKRRAMRLYPNNEEAIKNVWLLCVKKKYIAKLLNISERALYKRIKKEGLNKLEKREQMIKLFEMVHKQCSA